MRTPLFALLASVLGCSEYRALPPPLDAGVSPQGTEPTEAPFVHDSDHETFMWIREGKAIADAIGNDGVFTMTSDESFTRVGVVWEVDHPDREIAITARMSSVDGEWSPWLPVEETWRESFLRVGHVDAPSQRQSIIQLHIEGTEAASIIFIKVELIALPLRSSAIAATSTDIESRSFALGPNWLVNSRESWRAREPQCEEPVHTPRRVYIHHTVTPFHDRVTPEERMRSIQADHMDNRHFCDIGYHFVVSPDARIWQGVPETTRGAHVLGHNTDSVGVSFMGNYDVDQPTDEQLRNTGRLDRWLLDTYPVADNLLGHRDSAPKSCPGDHLYAELDTIEWLAAAEARGSEDCQNDEDDNDDNRRDCRDPTCSEDPLCTPRIDSVSCTGFYPGNRRGGGATCEVRGNFVEESGEFVERLWIDCLERTIVDNLPIMRGDGVIVASGLWRCNCPLGPHSAAYAIPGSPRSSGCDDPWGACLQNAVTIIEGCDGLTCGRDFCGRPCGECPDGCECTWEQWCDCADRCIASPIASCHEEPACDAALDQVRFVEGDVSPASGIANETEFTWRLDASVPGDEPPAAAVLIYNPLHDREFEFPMQLVQSGDGQYRFEYRGRMQDAVLYEYRFKVETCAGDSIEEVRRIGPDTRHQEPVCQPQPERCNNADDDCDGNTDQFTRECRTACERGTETCVVGQWGVCTARQPQPEVCDNVDNDCDGNLNNGVLNACGQCGPVPAEICDGRDNDCDRDVDEICPCAPVGAQQACGSNVGECRQGAQTCGPNGWGGCQGEVLPAAEICDNRDNDCDGNRDDNVTRNCSNECGNAGTQTCNAGQWGVCNAQVCPPQCVPQVETCNNRDDDCDGIRDDNVFRDCQNGCEGSEVCENGVWSACSPQPQPQPETCNNTDDDCDGNVDDGLTRECRTNCGVGIETCIAGSWQNCSVRLPTPETCNNADDDCNGARDDNLFRACQNGCGGVETCTNGQWSACPVQPQPEICDNQDNNCNNISDDNLTRACQNECGNGGTQTCNAGQWGACNAAACPPQCNAATFWAPSSMDASARNPNNGVTLTSEIRERADGGLEIRVCSGGNFQNQISVDFEEYFNSFGTELFNGVLNGVGNRCTPWGQLSQEEFWDEGEGLGGDISIVSPANCADRWERTIGCEAQANPGCGACWYMSTGIMTRTCRE